MPSLAEILRREEALLDEIFGTGGYELVDTDEHACQIRTDAAEVNLAHDWRDHLISSYIKPLAVPERLREMYLVETWLHFLDRRPPSSPQERLSRRQVRDELLLIRVALAEIFTDSQRTRDAANFCAGYGAAYNDCYSGHWDAAT